MIAEEILELVKSRSSPGVLILDLNNKLIYSNQEALAIFKNPDDLPPEVYRLCNEVKAHADISGGAPASGRDCSLLWREGEPPCSLRAFLIGARSKGQPPTHLMVLVERVTEQRGVNLQKAKNRYHLSDREIEVVSLVAQGLANKEIGSRLFLSEHTVKDHIKNIMRKMEATSRSEIIYILK